MGLHGSGAGVSVLDLGFIVPSIFPWACSSLLENLNSSGSCRAGWWLLELNVFFNHVALRPWDEEPMVVAWGLTAFLLSVNLFSGAYS